MDRYLDFTLDPVKFPPTEMKEFVDDLHSHGQHYVMIVDPGISNVQPAGSYPPYDNGLKANIFVNTTEGVPYSGVVWPGVIFSSW